MKTKLMLAIGTALLLSTAASAAQTDDESGSATVQTVKTVTTVQHINGSDATWYKEGGVVPTAYRGDNYAVRHWQDEHLNEPSEGSHWVRGNNGDFLLVDNDSGTITNIVQTPPALIRYSDAILRRLVENGSVKITGPFFWHATHPNSDMQLMSLDSHTPCAAGSTTIPSNGVESFEVTASSR